MLDYVVHHAKILLRPDKYLPELGSVTEGGPAQSPATFVMICPPGYRSSKPNASSTIRLGYCHAFARLGIRYKLTTALELASVLESVPNPFVFLSVYDYEIMDRQTCKNLRNVPHFVWAEASRKSLLSVYAGYGRKPRQVRTVSEYANRRAKESGPGFVWGTCTQRGLEHFSDWHDTGIPLISLPLACDDERYYPEFGSEKFKGCEMAFVGGYWANKAIQFDKYLRPYEKKLTIFGHSPWPYSGYKGLLNEADERVLYMNARLSPAISEPHVGLTGDIVERVFKVAGSGGVAITDVAPKYYYDIFSPDEILIPETLEHYHELVERALTDDAFNAKYRAAGIKAVLERHTYVHRARTVLEKLGLTRFVSAAV